MKLNCIWLCIHSHDIQISANAVCKCKALLQPHLTFTVCLRLRNLLMKAAPHISLRAARNTSLLHPCCIIRRVKFRRDRVKIQIWGKPAIFFSWAMSRAWPTSLWRKFFRKWPSYCTSGRALLRKIVMADLLWAVSSFSKHPYFTLMLLMLAMLTFGESNVLLVYY